MRLKKYFNTRSERFERWFYYGASSLLHVCLLLWLVHHSFIIPRWQPPLKKHKSAPVMVVINGKNLGLRLPGQRRLSSPMPSASPGRQDASGRYPLVARSGPPLQEMFGEGTGYGAMPGSGQSHGLKKAPDMGKLLFPNWQEVFPGLKQQVDQGSGTSGGSQGGPSLRATAKAPGIFLNDDSREYFQQKGITIDPWASNLVAVLCRSWFVSPDLHLPPVADVGVAISWDKQGMIQPSIEQSSGSPDLDYSALNAINLCNQAIHPPPAGKETMNLFALFHFQQNKLSPSRLSIQQTPAGAENHPLFSRIGLLHIGRLGSANPPDRLTLGIEMKQALPYLVERDGKNIAGGQLNMGMNSISLDVKELFPRSGEIHYLLKIKNGDQIVERPIRLQSVIQSRENSGLAPDALRKSGYGVALFLENRLLAWREKPLDARSQAQAKSRASNREDLLFNESRSIMKKSIPISAIPSIIKEIKQGLKKNKPPVPEEENPAYLCREFSADFLLPSPDSPPLPAHVTVSLS